MSIPNYDAWLQKPYDDQPDWELLAERAEEEGITAEELYERERDAGPDPDEARDRMIEREWDER